MASRPRACGADHNWQCVGTLGVRPPQDAVMSAPTPSRQPGLPALEAAIVAAEQMLTERLAHLAWCGSIGRDTTVAESLVRSADLRLEGLWRERDWRLGHGRDAGG